MYLLEIKMPEQTIPQPVAKTMSMSNPLVNYFRQPKIYIRLPSQGKYYPEDSIDLSQNDEYAVYAMTAKDELMFKTPDALMNGQATVEVVKSCVPAIKNPWNMPSIDLDAVLIGIRIATYGENMDVNSQCPSCSAENEYTVDLVGFLDTLNKFDFQDQLQVGELVIHVRPYTYQEVTKTALKTLEQQKIFQVVNDDSISDEVKVEQFGKSFVRLTELTVDVIAGCISQVDTPTGSVADAGMIKEFIANAPADVFKAVSDHVAKMKENIELKAQEVACQECGHEHSIAISMDQTNFFAVGS
jgi:hypothetical protein